MPFTNLLPPRTASVKIANDHITKMRTALATGEIKPAPVTDWTPRTVGDFIWVLATIQWKLQVCEPSPALHADIAQLIARLVRYKSPVLCAMVMDAGLIDMTAERVVRTEVTP